MPKIQVVGVGNFIRDPKRPGQVLGVVTNNGNSFTCYPVSRVDSGVPVYDKTTYQMISLDTNVELATI